jgi:hypothetical protein
LLDPVVDGRQVRSRADPLLVGGERGPDVLLVLVLPADRRLQQLQLAVEGRVPVGRGDRPDVLER